MATEERWRRYTDQKYQGKLTGNARYARKVRKMDMPTLLQEILDSPEYLTDSYYDPLGNPLAMRARELLEESKNA